jgi:flagellar biogenesis protein FliO
MDVLRQAGSVLLVFSLLGAVLWALRRGGRISIQGFARKRLLGSTKEMASLERLALTPQHTLHRVRVCGREILVATHPQGCTVLTEQAPMERAMSAQA